MTVTELRQKLREKAYTAWTNAKERTSNPNNPKYGEYGGRGIKMEESWYHSVDQFIMDIGLPLSEAHVLDRIDNDKGYQLGNVRWSTYTESNRNRRNVIRIEHKGRSYVLSELAKEYGLRPWTLNRRLKRGEPLEIALQKRSKGRPPKVKPINPPTPAESIPYQG